MCTYIHRETHQTLLVTFHCMFYKYPSNLLCRLSAIRPSRQPVVGHQDRQALASKTPLLQDF